MTFRCIGGVDIVTVILNKHMYDHYSSTFNGNISSLSCTRFGIDQRTNLASLMCVEPCADFRVSAAARQSILIGGFGASPVPKYRRRHGVIDFYAQVFQPKQPSHSHTLTLSLLCYSFSCISLQNEVF